MAVTRKRDYVERERSKVHRKSKAEEVHGPNYFLHLTLDVLMKILLILPVKSVLSCKCVCKSWLSIISSPQFVQLYSECAPVWAFLRTRCKKRVSRTLHLLNFDELASDNEAHHMKLDVKLKIPLCDAKMVVHAKHEARRRGNRTTRIACKPKDDRFLVANHCNGLLLLNSKFDFVTDRFHPMALVVCNPIIGEFIRLPLSDNNKRNYGYSYHYHGLGYLKKTDEYKVMSIYQKFCGSMIAEIHTLGTKLWRNIEFDESCLQMFSPTCLNGSLYWLVFNMGKTSILCFDLEVEMPKSFSFPLALSCDIAILDLGELKGSLFICCTNKRNCLGLRNCLRFWTMKEYGDSDSWTEIFRFDVNVLENMPFTFSPRIAFLSQGILIYDDDRRFVYYDPQRNLLSFFEGRGALVDFEPVFYSPSLMRLKDIVKGCDIEVYNVNSWCGVFKLHEEKEVLYLAKYKADLHYKGMEF